MIQQLKKILNNRKEAKRIARLRKESVLPRKLPVGLTEFNQFCDDIITLSGEFADRDSMVYAIASNIIHVKHDCDEVPLDYFVRCIRKAAANQVASSEFARIKEYHDKRVQEEAAKQQAEATAQPIVVANGTPEEV